MDVEQLTKTEVAEAKEVEAPFPLRKEDVEVQVRQYFQDIPVMADIARCESRFTHYYEDGSVVRGEKVKSDTGVMQVNTYYHGAAASKLGLDLTDFEDNMAYARYLYMKEGTTPWNSSAKCWKNSGHIAQK